MSGSLIPSSLSLGRGELFCWPPCTAFTAQAGERKDFLTVLIASSRGRGNRAAGWFSDYLADRGDGEMESLVLVEGIKGWATSGDEFVEWMDEYEAAVWTAK